MHRSTIGKNLSVSAINTEKNHSYYVPFERINWEKSDLGSSSQVKLLNGDWQFAYFKHPSKVPSKFYAGAIKQWDVIKVPSNWQLQSNKYDPPVFTNV